MSECKTLLSNLQVEKMRFVNKGKPFHSDDERENFIDVK